MHIHPNNNLQLASLGTGREQIQELQAKRAAEVRRKLSTALRVHDDTEDLSGHARHVERHSYQNQQRQGEEGSFGSFFSAKA